MYHSLQSNITKEKFSKKRFKRYRRESDLACILIILRNSIKRCTLLYSAEYKLCYRYR